MVHPFLGSVAAQNKHELRGAAVKAQEKLKSSTMPSSGAAPHTLQLSDRLVSEAKQTSTLTGDDSWMDDLSDLEDLGDPDHAKNVPSETQDSSLALKNQPPESREDESWMDDLSDLEDLDE